jgi:hypothetical protein
METMNRLGLRCRPKLETLESREVPAVVAPSSPIPLTQTTINDRMISFLVSRVGQQIGGGECAHVATEALRASGARFIPRPELVPGDYIWGNRVKVITTNGGWRDSAPTLRARPGDILQYYNARFSNGMWASQHTAIVATVDAQGRPTSVFEQNVNGRRTMVRSSIDLTKLTGGRVSIYRAEPRIAVPGRVEFTLTNNIARNVPVAMSVGPYAVGSTLIGTANQWNSYQTRWLRTPPGMPLRLTVGTTTVTIQNGAGYEIFTLANGQPSIRRI